MSRPALLLPIALLAVSCRSAGSPLPPPPAATTTATTTATTATVVAARPAPERLAADAPRATPGGTTFTAPAAWTLAIDADAGKVLLEAPDPDLHVVVVDTRAANADAAVAAAWAAYKPEMKRPLKISQQVPARQGWEERRNFEYETSPNEKLVVFALAMRHGAAWTVALVEGGEASFEKRASQVNLALQSLRPQGYKRESFAGKSAHKLDAERLKVLTDFVERGRQDAGVPGLAIALVQDDKVVFAGGFGVRAVGKPEKIDADTLFMIASNTKALTTLMLAKLVDEKRFSWSTAVTEVYPAFKLGDAATTKQVEIKHLICACTGLPRQDMEWLMELSGATPSSMMTLLGTMQPTTKFGEVFQYSNMLAAAAGFVGGSVVYPGKELGAAYDEAMKTRVFQPLGMSATTFDFDRALKVNHASAYGTDVDGKLGPAKMAFNRAVIPVRPAGEAWSNVNDVARYLRMELARGKLPDGTRYVSEASLLARRAPQVLIGEDHTYGMGLMVDTRWGVPVVHHGGDLAGYHSDMFFLPEHGVGGVILTAADDGAMLRRPFLRRVMEVLFDGEAEAAGDLKGAIERKKQAVAKERQRLTLPPDPAVVAQLAPRYGNASLGAVAIRTQGTTTMVDVGEWTSPVATRKNDDGTVSLVMTDPSIAGFELVIGQRDSKRVLIVRDAQHEYVLVETP